jgi:hypothetical protein
MTTDTQQPQHHRRRMAPLEDRGGMHQLRQVLNLVFILGAILGMVLYFKAGRDTGTYVLIGACVFKFVEVTLRIMKL